MNLNFLKQVWLYINELPSTLKTIVIVTLGCIIVYYTLHTGVKELIKLSIEKTLLSSVLSEEYTIEMSEAINNSLSEILTRDGTAYDVILLLYHNSKKTLQGFSYVYLDYLTDAKIDPSKQSVKKIFLDLDWMYYADELKAILESNYLRYDNTIDLKIKFPKLYYDTFRYIDAKSIAIYPLSGIDSYLGMIIILYDKPKKYEIGYFDKVIAPSAEKLSTILDYNNIKNKIGD